MVGILIPGTVNLRPETVRGILSLTETSRDTLGAGETVMNLLIGELRGIKKLSTGRDHLHLHVTMVEEEVVEGVLVLAKPSPTGSTR